MVGVGWGGGDEVERQSGEVREVRGAVACASKKTHLRQKVPHHTPCSWQSCGTVVGASAFSL